MAVHFSIHAWKIPWTEEPGGLQFMGSQELDMTQELRSDKGTTPGPAPHPQEEDF